MRTCKILLTFSLILLTSTVTIVNLGKVGTVCQRHDHCGTNEFCKKAEFLETPCLLGKCSCSPCYGVNKNGDCVPVKKVNLNDSCKTQNSFILLPENANCSSENVVVCSAGWVNTGNVCKRNMSTVFGASCQWSADCSSDMWCDDRSRCTCYNSYDKYDFDRERCIKKEYGDACQSSHDCRVLGRNWQGFTYTTGDCNAGRCECSSNGKLVVASYLDEETGDVGTKPICVTSNARVNVSVGERCTVDPIYNGEVPTVSVCQQNSFCFQCPEDLEEPNFSSIDGKCRTLSGIIEQYKCIGNGDYVDNGDSFFDDDPEKPDFSGDFEMPSQGPVVFEEFVLGSVVNGTWFSTRVMRRCSSDGECFANEQCLMSAMCGRGICVCAPPNQEDENGRCISTWPFGEMAQSRSEQLLIEVEEESFLSTDEILPTVLDVQNDALLLPGETRENELFYQYGMNCSSNADCLPLKGTTCQETKSISSYPISLYACTCPWKMYWYNNSFCKMAEYGDPCASDWDCDNGIYTFTGFRCSLGRCSCAVNYTAISASVVRAYWGTTGLPSWLSASLTAQQRSRRVYCIHQTVTIRKASVNEACTADLVGNSSPGTREISLCAGLTCLFCAGDTTHGICTDLRPDKRNMTVLFLENKNANESKNLSSASFKPEHNISFLSVKTIRSRTTSSANKYRPKPIVLILIILANL